MLRHPSLSYEAIRGALVVCAARLSNDECLTEILKGILNRLAKGSRRVQPLNNSIEASRHHEYLRCLVSTNPIL